MSQDGNSWLTAYICTPKNILIWLPLASSLLAKDWDQNWGTEIDVIVFLLGIANFIQHKSKFKLLQCLPNLSTVVSCTLSSIIIPSSLLYLFLIKGLYLISSLRISFSNLPIHLTILTLCLCIDVYTYVYVTYFFIYDIYTQLYVHYSVIQL